MKRYGSGKLNMIKSPKKGHHIVSSVDDITGVNIIPLTSNSAENSEYDTTNDSRIETIPE